MERELLKRIQHYVRLNAVQRSNVIVSSPFTFFLHPSDRTIAANFATVDEPLDPSDLPRALAAVSREFAIHDRASSILFIGDIPNSLISALLAAGFPEHRREAVMACRPDWFHPVPSAPGVTVVTLDSSSPLDLVRESIHINERGFDPAFRGPVTDAAAEAYRARLVDARAFLAYLDGESAGAGMIDPPVGGVTELSGVTTIEPFRRHGVATALTECAVMEAFSQRIDMVFLTTQNEDAQRVYQRVGFCLVGAKILVALQS
jgi:ribosomal protein S18 acetylase RimI-like enzyme